MPHKVKKRSLKNQHVDKNFANYNRLDYNLPFYFSSLTSLMSHKPTIRLDKWLWASRLYKTRALAQEMIQGGKVRYNAQRCKPSKAVIIGDTIELWQGNVKKEIIIEGLSDKRSNFDVAQKLYRETQASLAAQEKQKELNKLIAKDKPSKPTKKQRRQIVQFKTNNATK
jgi:ribosome-associated heat shock protein Hsp15